MSHLINSLSLTKIDKRTWVLEREGTSCYMFSRPTFLLFFSSPSLSFLSTKQTGQTVSCLSTYNFFFFCYQSAHLPFPSLLARGASMIFISSSKSGLLHLCLIILIQEETGPMHISIVTQTPALRP